MQLNDLRLMHDNKTIHISIEGEIISAVTENTENKFSKQLNFAGAFVFPGLINAHDHLDFNCFHPLGEKIYSNYQDWGKDIHENFRTEIDKVLKIPEQLRSLWGMYKNLIAGVTTVVNHGAVLHIENPLINIDQRHQSLHSTAFEKNVKLKLNNPFLKNKLCIIHTGEGTDERAATEIDELLRWNLLKRKIVGIHAVAMTAEQAKGFHGLVWCPESNRVLLGKYADISTLKKNTTILFGTDSTLTGNWNIWQHLRLAKATGLVTDKELFNILNISAAKILELNSGEISAGKDADIVITRSDNFFETDPKDILLVMSKGKIRLFDESLLPQIAESDIDPYAFTPVNMNGAVKFIEGDLIALMNAIKDYYPEARFPACEIEELQTAADA